MSLRFPSSSQPQVTKPGAPSNGTDYADFVLEARRKNAREILVRVAASSAGAMEESVAVKLPKGEVTQIRESFRSNLATGGAGKMLITQAEASVLGEKLGAVLFPRPVFRLFAQSLADAMRHVQGGVRIRLALDESLVDLPWEYVQRPDRLHTDGISSFLLLDPHISMVRQEANPAIALQSITGRRGLAFVGTFWEGQVDGWQVYHEFELLRDALNPVAKYISLGFALASDESAFQSGGRRDAAIFHYGGHCDFDASGMPYLVREMPTAGSLHQAPKLYLDQLAAVLKKWGTRFAVLSACNSGFWPVVKPLLDAGVPALVGVNGAVSSQSTIEFCAKLYESLAVGLTLDEAVGRARLHLLSWGQQTGMFDWGLFMVYMPSPQAVLFSRLPSPGLAKWQKEVRRDHGVTIDQTLDLVRQLDGLNFGEIMSKLSDKRVLILGRFTGRRLKVLEAIEKGLAEHPNRYIPELFTFKKPERRDLVESITAFAGLSRFIVADLSEPRSVQSELEAIVPRFVSVPVVPIISRTGKEYATFDSIRRRENVIQPTLRYRDLDDLLEKLGNKVVQPAEAKLTEQVT